MQTKNFSIDGFSLQYGKNDNQGSDQVFLTSVQKGKIFFLKNLTEFSLLTQKNTSTADNTSTSSKNPKKSTKEKK